jgi:hypothetical protein
MGTPVKEQHFPDAVIAEDLAKGQQTETLSGRLKDDAPLPATIPSRWMQGAIDEEVGLLKAAGIARIGFYAPPSRQADDPVYARKFCRAVTEYPCLLAADPDLIAALGHDEDWLDTNHLHGPGRDLYSAWLARRLAANGVLP